MGKRILSIFLVAAMILASMDMTVFASDVGQCVGVTKQIQSKKGRPHFPPKAMTVKVIVFFLAVIDGQNEVKKLSAVKYSTQGIKSKI